MRAALTFHGIDPSGSVLSVAPDQLRGLLTAIRGSGHEIVSLNQLLEAPGSPARVALTFDDGFRSVHDEALPILRDAGVTATLFLTTGFLGTDNGWPGQPSWAPRFPLLDWDQVEALHEAGWQIEAHTEHHADLRGLSNDALDEELGRADDAIEARLGRRPQSFAYPYGYLDPTVRGAAARRYRSAWTTELASLDGGTPDPLRLPRLDAYYLREPRVHRRFGGAAFRGYLAARRLLRELRAA